MYPTSRTGGSRFGGVLGSAGQLGPLALVAGPHPVPRGAARGADHSLAALRLLAVLLDVSVYLLVIGALRSTIVPALSAGALPLGLGITRWQ